MAFRIALKRNGRSNRGSNGPGGLIDVPASMHGQSLQPQMGAHCASPSFCGRCPAAAKKSARQRCRHSVPVRCVLPRISDCSCNAAARGRSPGTAMARARRSAVAPKPKNRKAASSTPREIEAFVLPAFDPTDHLLYLSSEPGQIHGRAIGTVAVRTAAIDDEQRIGRVAA